MTTLIAIAFGNDGVQGDSAFIPSDENPLAATEDSTFEYLLAAWHKQGKEAGNVDEDTEEPTGFWLLTKEHLALACIPMENDWGNDSQWYSLVRSSKSICKRMAVKTVEKGA